MSRQSASIAAVILTAIALAGCGGGTTKRADPWFSKHPTLMQRFCSDYYSLLNNSGWTDNQIYDQIKDTGVLDNLSLNTFRAQIRWCYNHSGTGA